MQINNKKRKRKEHAGSERRTLTHREQVAWALQGIEWVVILPVNLFLEKKRKGGDKGEAGKKPRSL